MSDDKITTAREDLPQVDCVHCKNSTCSLVSNQVGFAVGIGRPLCEACLSEGVDSEKSVALRVNIVNRVLHQIRTNPETKNKVVAFAGWQKTRLSWKAGSAWLRSKASKVLGSVPLPILETRKKSCFGRVSSEACPMLKKHTDGFHYCGACGCGVREDTRLDGNPSKLEYPYLQCPLGKPGFSNEKVPDRILREVSGDADASGPREKGTSPVPQPLGQAGGPHIVPPAG